MIGSTRFDERPDIRIVCVLNEFVYILLAGLQTIEGYELSIQWAIPKIH
jgi:hypothetical protein